MYIEQKQDKILRPTSIYTRSAQEDNQITTELQNLITAAGLTPSADTLTQVKTAVEILSGGSANKANINLDNLTDDAKIPVTNMLTGIYDTVGYTVVGTPTISNGIASGFSRNAYVKTASKLSYTSSDTVEINIRFQTGAELPASFVSIATTGEYDDAFIYTYAHYLYCNLNSSQALGELYTDLETDSWYTVNLQYSSGTLNRYLYDNAGQLLASDTQTTTPNNFEQFVCWGTNGASTNAIDFNSTYIKLNGEMWFIGRTTEVKNNFFTRAFTPLNVTVAQGDASIAGTYTLTNLPNDGVIRLALFECGLVTYANNYSAMALATDVSTTAGVVCGANNFHTANSLALLPVKQTVTISFPSTAGAVVSPTGIKLLGYF